MTMNRKKILPLNLKWRHPSKRKPKRKKKSLHFSQKRRMMVQLLSQNQKQSKSNLSQNLPDKNLQSQSLNLLKSQKDHFLIRFLNNKTRKVQQFCLPKNQFSQSLNQLNKCRRFKNLLNKNHKKWSGWRKLLAWAVNRWWVWHKWFQRECTLQDHLKRSKTKKLQERTFNMKEKRKFMMIRPNISSQNDRWILWKGS